MNFRNVIAAAVLVAAMPFAAIADERAVREVLQGYEKALNASDAMAVTELFTEDAVVMAPNNPSAVGRETIGKVYGSLFEAVKLDIRFAIDEIHPLSETWAFARTHSDFTVQILGGNAKPQADGNQELFLLQKDEDGQWRIARYSYSSTKPAAK